MPKPAATTLDTIPDRFLTGPQVAARYGVNVRMTLWRWCNHADYADLEFPQPAFRVRDRRFWRESDLVAWERRRAARTLERKPAKNKQHTD
jgi:predicted DNA-binding transcriptional regulator AlpA